MAIAFTTKSIRLCNVRSGLVQLPDDKNVYKVLSITEPAASVTQRPYLATLQDTTTGRIRNLRFNSNKTCRRVRIK